VVARNRLVLTALGLVFSLARRRARAGQHLREEDLAQAGAMGAMRAADRFDPEIHPPFRVFAKPHIVKAISGTQWDEEDLIRVPSATRRAMHGVARLRAEGIEPTTEAIFERTRHVVSTRGLVRVLELGDLRRPLSLDVPLVPSETHSETLLDMVASDEPTPEDMCANREARAALERTLASLPETERRILLARASGLSLAEAGQAGGVGGRPVSRQRVLQIETKAWARLEKRRGMSTTA
jgi:RNA polymerase sigma-B factor